MKVLSLPPELAQLCVTRQPCQHISCAGFPCMRRDVPMVKRTSAQRDPCPDDLIGQRIALAATDEEPPLHAIFAKDWKVFPQRGGWILEHYASGHPGAPADIPLPLGVIVGSATVEAIYEIAGEHDWPLPIPRIERTDQDLLHIVRSGGEWADISDQLAYDEFRPGRFALILTDAAPCTERCPWCWGEREERCECVDRHDGSPDECPDCYMGRRPCRICGEIGHCPPIPWTSPDGTGLAEWSPT